MFKDYYHLDSNNIVDAVHSVEVADVDGNEVTNLGPLLCQQRYRHPSSEWVECSYHVEVGDLYLSDEDAIYPPKPYPSWVKRTETKNWKSPIGDPPALSEEERNHTFDWDEENQQWVKMDPAPKYQ